MSQSYDIIVIGAGCGGLSAALCAAKQGKKVLIIERGSKVGGLTTSFTRGRFTFDTSLNHLYGMSSTAGVGDVRRILDDFDITNKLEWVEIPEAFRLITKNREGDDIDVIMPFGIENFTDAMEEYVPGSKASIAKLFEVAEEIQQAVADIEAQDGDFGRKEVKQIIKKYYNFVHTAPYSANEVFLAMGIPQGAIDILNAMWMHFGVDCDKFSFTHYASFLYKYIKYGSQLPKNRSSAIADAILNEFLSLGGTIIYNDAVTGITVENNCVTGVTTHSGQEFPCKHVICNCSPTVAYAKYIGNSSLPQSAIKRTNARKLGARSACVYLGLNRSAEELGIEDYSVIITDEADSSDQATLMNAIETNNAQTAVCLNVANPDCSPEDTTILCLSTIYTDDCWSGVQPEDYFNEKDMLAARLIANYETATGISIHDYIEELEVSTPVTFARYAGTPQGVTHGYYAYDWDNVITRFMTEKTDNDINGLRFCGAWGTQLNGIGAAMASGVNAACATLCDLADEGGAVNE
ncbi:MAG: NAD(P)/FAD-dependent oxidoreductase [Clostridia bacterium]|nr:NAD(P)/FAD-dependent oxidoreductase [Clostridia bacterium]